jgi:hypothetical protein
MICSHPFKTAYSHRGLVGSASSTGRFTRTITDTTQYARENIAFPVLDISIGEIALGDFSDVFRYVCVRRAGPLTVYNLVIIIRIISVRGLHF